MEALREAPPPSHPERATLLAAGGPPAWLGGAAIALALLAVLAVVEFVAGDLRSFLRGEALPQKVDEYRFSLTLVLLAGYLPAALGYAVATSRRALRELTPVLRRGADVAALCASVGRFEPRARRRAGLLGVAAALCVPFVVDASFGAYSLRAFNTASLGHRLLLPPVGWLLGRFVQAVTADSVRFARLGRSGVEVDVLDLAPLSPFTRKGLGNALLVMGLLAILAPLLADWQARPGLIYALGTGLVLAAAIGGVGLLLPVRGVHDAIRAAKRTELAWCSAEIRRRRDALVAGTAGPGAGLAEWVSYRQLLESVREWPFGISTALRFVLYVGIPLGSWIGGAVVDRIVDAALG
jgi:hypothetical protein